MGSASQADTRARIKRQWVDGALVQHAHLIGPIPAEDLRADAHGGRRVAHGAVTVAHRCEGGHSGSQDGGDNDQTQLQADRDRGTRPKSTARPRWRLRVQSASGVYSVVCH